MVQTDIGRFDVPVNDAQAVGVSQRLGQFCNDLHALTERNCSGGDQLGQAAALNQRHRDVMAVAIVAGLIDRHDPGMAKTCQCSGLTEKSLPSSRCDHHALARQLQGYVAFKERIKGAIDRGVMALAHDVHDLEPAQLPAVSRRHWTSMRFVLGAVLAAPPQRPCHKPGSRRRLGDDSISSPPRAGKDQRRPRRSLAQLDRSEGEAPRNHRP